MILSCIKSGKVSVIAEKIPFESLRLARSIYALVLQFCLAHDHQLLVALLSRWLPADVFDATEFLRVAEASADVDDLVHGERPTAL